MTMLDIDVLFIVLDCQNANECCARFDICDLWDNQTICGTLISKYDKKLNLQFMKEP